MPALYNLVVFGTPLASHLDSVEGAVRVAVDQFRLTLGGEISWEVRPASFLPDPVVATAALYFGSEACSDAGVQICLDHHVPVIPVVTTIDKVATEIPAVLHAFNCVAYSSEGPTRIANALLECVGLLPRERRVFLSYARAEAREAAVQLFDAFSARSFDVFLDTHGVAPAENFQAILWHRLCDSDVLVMLDTPGYFARRWTSAEFGRALAKGLSILRVGWPDCTPSPRTATASRAELVSSEVDANSGRLSQDAVNRICLHLEAVRSEGHAVRFLNLASSVRSAIERVGGRVSGLGSRKAIHVVLADGREVVVYPTVGVPTSATLHEAVKHRVGGSVAVVYDHIGMQRQWLDHLDWLGSHVKTARWVKASEVAWDMADW